MEPQALQARLSLLGDLELTFDGDPLPLPQPAQRVLAYLAVVHRRRPVRRTTLAERLWPETPPSRACASLRSVLWRLPRPRGRTLVAGSSSTVRLHPDVAVDLWEAEELAAALCSADPPARVSPEQLAPLHCDLLPDSQEEWLVVEQEAFRQKRLHALERVAALWCEDGRFTEALSAGLGAVRSEPLRESAHRRVIAVHLAEGNHAEALRQYDGYRRLLAQELGLPPSPAIRSMVAPLLGRPVDAHRG
ncbi:AfsR/SARP family transcriptional regulator [Nocardioides caldifontis]|uniref:AfsR/SARP family transcriptional regulator n=1 Tax=Nocardioides caldifontis TaxID=2588938 RepID=UPI0011E05320|nr:BTAD domain-containing putative transcriptional regulator [Nocardioides caldifontis]